MPRVSSCCNRLNFKLKELGYPTLNQLWLRAADFEEEGSGAERLGDWFVAEGIDVDTGDVVVKMARGSESIGTHVCSGLATAWATAASVMAHPMVRSCRHFIA